MAKPLSEELVIEWGTEDAKPKLFTPRENVSFVVTDKVPRTPRIVELTLMPLAQPLRFWPGQYVTLGGGRVGIPDRSYSIANAPRQDGAIVLQVARAEEGATSVWIHDELKVGDLVRLSGPYGTFIGDPAVDTPVLCIAAGSGLAPILSLAEAALRRGFSAPVALIFSARTKDDVYDQGLMAYWQMRYRNFRFIPTLTREQAPGMQHGRVPDILPKLFPDLSGHSIFAAGSPEFVDACMAASKSLGAKDELMHTEGFFSQDIA
jgi:CDP-4-dehydro-6-deoxyglucose reductase